MKIIDLKLRNFKRFIKEDISFDRPLTVLVGKNNSGKSTLLEVLADLSLLRRTASIVRNKKVRGSHSVQLELRFQLNESDWKEIISTRQEAVDTFIERKRWTKLSLNLVSMQ